MPYNEAELDKFFDSLFRYVEEDAISVLDWYLIKKSQKSRWSKLLRVGAILLVSAGAVIPIISLLTDKRLDPEWALIAIAGAACFVFFDRAFGYSASWARYLVTSMVLTDIVRKHQLLWAGLCTSKAAGATQLEYTQKALELIDNFSSAVMEAVEHETEQWTQQLREALDELRSRASNSA